MVDGLYRYTHSYARICFHSRRSTAAMGSIRLAADPRKVPRNHSGNNGGGKVFIVMSLLTQLVHRMFPYRY